MLKKSVLAAMVATVVLCSGCSSNVSKKPIPSMVPQKTVQMKYNGGMNSAHIKDMSTAAEDVYTSAEKANWNNAAKVNSMLKASLNSTNNMPIQQTAQSRMTSGLKATLTKLDTAIKTKDSYLSKKYSNQLYKSLCNLTATTNSSAANNITNVKYLCREISLNCESGNIAAAKQDTAALIKCWDTVKQPVSIVYPADCTKTQDVVNALNKSINANDLGKTKSLCSQLVSQSSLIENEITSRRI